MMKDAMKNVVRGCAVLAVMLILCGFYELLYGSHLGYPAAHRIDVFTLPLQFAIFCATIWVILTYKVDYRKMYEPYMKGEEKKSFLPQNPFLVAFGNAWQEQYLPEYEQVGSYRYTAYWTKEGKIAVMVRRYGEEPLLYCKAFTPPAALSVIEDINQWGEPPEELLVSVPKEDLEPIHAIR